MGEFEVRLDEPVDGALADELNRRIFFVSPDIVDFRLLAKDDRVVAVAVTTAGDPVAGDVVDGLTVKINRVAAREVVRQRTLPTRVIWESARPRSDFADPLDALVDAGLVYEAGEGQMGFGGHLVPLFEFLDRRIRAAVSPAVEYRYPTLLPVRALDRFGYLASFPQFLMFTTRLHNDLDTYEEVVGRYRDRGMRVTPDILRHCANVDYCLPPTICYHTFEQYHGRVVDTNLVVTARGKAFRFESRYRSGLMRLWDFTIREIVMMGEPEFAAAARRRVMSTAFSLVDELGLHGRCQAATDHFFAGGDSAARVFAQRLMESKYELMLDVGSGGSIAVGSFNLHEQFFGEAFGITTGTGAPITSACAGFGLERLMFAFLCQHGCEPGRWPPSVRDAVLGSRRSDEGSGA